MLLFAAARVLGVNDRIELLLNLFNGFLVAHICDDLVGKANWHNLVLFLVDNLWWGFHLSLQQLPTALLGGIVVSGGFLIFFFHARMILVALLDDAYFFFDWLLSVHAHVVRGAILAHAFVAC